MDRPRPLGLASDKGGRPCGEKVWGVQTSLGSQLFPCIFFQRIIQISAALISPEDFDVLEIWIEEPLFQSE